MLTGAELIISERVRQEELVGYTAEHDDKHTHGELAIAGAAYAAWAGNQAGYNQTAGDAKQFEWPFEMSEWRPSKDLIGTLVKAGALIAAEIDRLQRSQVKQDRNASGT